MLVLLLLFRPVKTALSQVAVRILQICICGIKPHRKRALRPQP